MHARHKYCLGCWYILDGLPSNRCPECGRTFASDDPRTFAVEKRSRRPRILIRLGAFLAVVLLNLAVILPALSPVPIFRSIKIVEQLLSPIAVQDWAEDGLLLADGRQIQLPGFTKLPAVSPALSEATKRGIEITNGSVYGLMRIHHWCGNDPVREHIARVDLSQLLTFLDEGEHLNESVQASWPGSGRISQSGWNVSEYFRFRSWTNMLKDGDTSMVGAIAQ
ncbi:MAG: hypothetical protein IH987_06325 [Planctomycetes bacterium]|nr:hypothetical protein [Planctomycetota bacterium]